MRDIVKNSRHIIKSAQLTEKSTRLSGSENKYFFEVATKANKLEIKRAVEELFKVTVTAVNTANFAGKKRRERTHQYGKTADWKRAIVTLKAGDKIEYT